MSSCRSLVAAVLFAAAGAAGAQSVFPGIGRAATSSEVAAWDIDVRPDFKGLPKGKGSVNQGQDVWESKCASCHGVFGEANSVFSPLVGGTTKDDVKTGRVARLNDPAFPGRTTLLKVMTHSKPRGGISFQVFPPSSLMILGMAGCAENTHIRS